MSGLHCGYQDVPVTDLTAAGHPAPGERAPLRQAGRGPGYQYEITVIPLLVSGLHCGGKRWRIYWHNFASSRSW